MVESENIAIAILLIYTVDKYFETKTLKTTNKHSEMEGVQAYVDRQTVFDCLDIVTSAH